MTGKAAGDCGGCGASDFAGSGGRAGRGGRGSGPGWRSFFGFSGEPAWVQGGGQPNWNASATAEKELEMLKKQAGFLQRSLEGVQSRIAELVDRNA